MESSAERVQALCGSLDYVPLADRALLNEELVALRCQSRSIQNDIERLVASKTRVDDAITAHLWSLSPLRTFPQEVISEIFKAGADQAQDPFDPLAFPYTVSQVCSRWRNIALSSETLWSKMVIAPDFDDDGCFRKRAFYELDWSGDVPSLVASCLTAWGERAGSMGIHVSFLTKCDPDDAEEFEEIYQFIITSNTTAWGGLEIAGWHYLDPLPMLNATSFPNLLHLTIRVAYPE